MFSRFKWPNMWPIAPGCCDLLGRILGHWKMAGTGVEIVEVMSIDLSVTRHLDFYAVPNPVGHDVG